jgi:two-component system, OmpR family, response regulator
MKRTAMNTIKHRILVVDDETSFTRLLKLNLERTGRYEVRTENRSTEALVAAREFQPELILLDVMMPGLDGGTLASYFLESPMLEGVPVVFLTATVTKEEVSSHGGLIGGLPFLAKPVGMAELEACLENHLAASAREQSGMAALGKSSVVDLARSHTGAAN